MDWLQQLNDASLPFILWLQGFASDGLTGFMTAMSWLGRDYFYILFFPFLYWCVSKRWGVISGFVLVISLYTGEWIKWAFKMPRPPSPPVEKWWTETSPGFVSTHAAPALGVWGALALLARRSWVTLVAVLLWFLISLSRLYLGVHYPGDVIGGWLVGAIALWLSFRILPEIGKRARAWSATQQVIGAVALTAILLLIFPGDWEGNRPAESGVLTASLLLGLLLGLIWDHHSLHFEVQGPWSRRILRYFAGLVLVFAAFLGLDILFEPFSQGAYLVVQALRLIRYAAVGFVVSGLAPWLFARLKLT